MKFLKMITIAISLLLYLEEASSRIENVFGIKCQPIEKEEVIRCVDEVKNVYYFKLKILE